MDDDAALMVAISDRLIDAVGAAVGPWVEGCVIRLAPQLRDEARQVGRDAAAEVVAELRRLLATDIDEQRTTPLAVIRSAGRFPTALLTDAGVVPPVRDPFEVRNNPGDVYGLGPATWSDLGDEVGEAGIAWGAAKAHLHLRRHRRP